jgi:hypothetical protein
MNRLPRVRSSSTPGPTKTSASCSLSDEFLAEVREMPKKNLAIEALIIH